MQNIIIAEKSYAFAIRVIRAYKYLREKDKFFALSDQFLRSGTAIGALVHEAKFAQSRKDFINKMNIALKEASETDYWIRLLHDGNFIDDAVFESIRHDCEELIRMLVKIVKTTKQSTKEDVNRTQLNS